MSHRITTISVDVKVKKALEGRLEPYETWSGLLSRLDKEVPRK